jgi:hypothetical protein
LRAISSAAAGFENRGAASGVEPELEPGDNDLRIMDGPKPPCGVVAGGVGRVFVDAEAPKGDIDVASVDDVFAAVAVLAAAANEPPERKALTNCGLAAVKLVRERAVVAFITGD